MFSKVESNLLPPLYLTINYYIDIGNNTLEDLSYSSLYKILLEEAKVYR